MEPPDVTFLKKSVRVKTQEKIGTTFSQFKLSLSVRDKSQAVLTQTLFIYKFVSTLLPLAPVRLAHAVTNKDFLFMIGTSKCVTYFD